MSIYGLVLLAALNGLPAVLPAAHADSTPGQAGGDPAGILLWHWRHGPVWWAWICPGLGGSHAFFTSDDPGPRVTKRGELECDGKRHLSGHQDLQISGRWHGHGLHIASLVVMVTSVG